jgi:tRNA U34 2-thiouridine synthase MnmA/TrmU
MKCLALHSGGLDSTLAIRVIQEQGIEVEAVRFFSVFDAGLSPEEVCAREERAAARLGVRCRMVPFSEDLLALVKSPKHGHGSHLNPCIDCHARMFQRAAGMMAEVNASFLITGEVLGERPMSQRRESLKTVERDAGVEGLLLRPLCAKLLAPTIPEEKGWVDRERLLSFSGRNRRPQFELARKLGVKEYPSPAGGCLLTDPGFSARLAELMRHDPDCTVADVWLLKAGRHFRLAPQVKAVVGRNEAENLFLERQAQAGDVVMLAGEDIPGPITLVRGPATEEHLRTMAAFTVKHGKAALRASAPVLVRPVGGAERRIESAAAPAELVEALRIAPPERGGRGGADE